MLVNSDTRVSGEEHRLKSVPPRTKSQRDTAAKSLWPRSGRSTRLHGFSRFVLESRDGEHERGPSFGAWRYPPTRIWGRELKSPKTFNSHKTTTMTTTAFKMDLIVPCIGMKRLMSQSRTPTTIKTITMFIRGMSGLLAQRSIYRFQDDDKANGRICAIHRKE